MSFKEAINNMSSSVNKQGINKQKFYNISKQSKEILRRMREKRIFSIDIGCENNELLIGGECDEYFYDELSSDDCLVLSNLFRELSDCIEPKYEGIKDFIRKNRLEMAKGLTALSDEFKEMYGASTVLQYYSNVINAIDFILDSSIESIEELISEIQKILCNGFSKSDSIESITIDCIPVAKPGNLLSLNIVIDWLCDVLRHNQSVEDIVVIAIIAINKILLNNDLGVIHVSEELSVKLNSLVLDSYRTNDSRLLGDFIEDKCILSSQKGWSHEFQRGN